MATVPMLAPDGTSGDIPQNRIPDAMKAGFKLAVDMTAPDGTRGYIPLERRPDAIKAGFKDAAGQEPSTAKLYSEALFNPVGSGAHPQGIVGGLEQAGGRALSAAAAPVIHPLDTAKALLQSIAETSPFAPSLQPNGGPIANRTKEFTQEFKESPALALENAAGDAAGAVEGGRLIGAAGESVRPAMEGVKTTALVQRGQAAVSKLVPPLVDGPPESLVTRAIKPGKNNINWNADVQKAIPLMKSAESELGHPVQGVDDALEAANLAKKAVWKQYQARLGAAGQMGAAIDGNAVADAMVNSIDRRTALQNPGLLARVQKIADTYRRPISLDEAEDFLQSANKDLNSYYAKNKVGQQVAQNDPEISSTVAEAQALRNGLYSKLDQVSGPGAAQLKQAYGSLTNVEKELYGRQLVAARQNPESLSEQLSTVRGAGKIAKGVFTANPGDVIEGAQNIAVSRALKARNSSDAMIERAFAKAKPATPFPMPASPRLAGLLQRGPIEMGAPSGSPNPLSQAPPIANTTRAQRLGLLLPTKTGGPIELPYVPEMSAGEKLAALMQYLREHPQKVLPAKASAIRLLPPR